MATITLHEVDPVVDRRIREIARHEKTSINRATQALLRRALGMDQRPNDYRKDFKEFAGRWKQADLKEFSVLIADLSRIDPEDWK